MTFIYNDHLKNSSLKEYIDEMEMEEKKELEQFREQMENEKAKKLAKVME